MVGVKASEADHFSLQANQMQMQTPQIKGATY